MKKLSLFVFVLAMMGSLSVKAEESRLSGEAGIDYYTDYIWRGIVASSAPSVQPGIGLSYADLGPGSLSFSYWGSSYLADAESDEANVIENDYTFSYALDAGPVSIEAGVIYYAFAGTAGDGYSFTEVYASFGVGLFETDGASAGLSFAVYRDTDDTKGTYYNLGIGGEFSLNETITAGLSAGVGYGDSRNNVGYYGNAGDSIADIMLEASVSMPINETFSVSAAVGYINVPNSDFDDAVKVAEDDTYAKIGISASF